MYVKPGHFRRSENGSALKRVISCGQATLSAIHEDLVATLAVGAVAHSSVTRYLREMRDFAPTQTPLSIFP
jgi:hypothetical protein